MDKQTIISATELARRANSNLLSKLIVEEELAEERGDEEAMNLLWELIDEANNASDALRRIQNKLN